MASLLEFQEKSTSDAIERLSKMRTKMHPLVLVIKRFLVAFLRAVLVKSEISMVVG